MTDTLPPCPPTTDIQPTSNQSSPNISATGQKRTREEAQLDTATTSNSTTASTTTVQSTNTNEQTYEPPKQAVFIVVVGGRPFRLSWESLKSDGPKNFFTEFFRKRKNARIMHIDRDPDMFALVVHHLRGYHVQPRDALQNQALLSDANYYGLKRLRAFLLRYLFVNVGGRIFRLPWSLFNKEGESINYFTGPVFDIANTPNGNGIQTGPSYIDRDPDLFQDIVTHLRGYTVTIRDETHRKNLIKDAQYYAFTKLRDKLLVARETLVGFAGDQECPEVLVHLQDVRPSSLIRTTVSSPSTTTATTTAMFRSDNKPLQYKRSGTPHLLFVQVSDFNLKIRPSDIIKSSFSTGGSNLIQPIPLSAEFCEPAKRKLRELSQGLSLKSTNETHVMLDDACAMTVDDQTIRHLESMKGLDNWKGENQQEDPQGQHAGLNLFIERSITQIHVVNDQLVLYLVRFEGISSRFELNKKREFLSG
ncbi:hypothetical protein BDA99DRAFT_117878 [Phascolomyces articulosus]|uniref:BTB domain-containing protein n=1 Tax=Phascolomyces articulosus TaxID=60185 RepID=A0AAD5KAH3_9FUNG|nr:hypothetical protein BDA99DRAFT_117878 [Phascolomyces articulosus]